MILKSIIDFLKIILPTHAEDEILEKAENLFIQSVLSHIQSVNESEDVKAHIATCPIITSLEQMVNNKIEDTINKKL